MFEFLKKSRVTVTSINLKWKGSQHSLGSMKVKGSVFEVKIPFQNKPQDDYNLDFLKTQKKPPVPIRKIEVKEPFKLISITPQLPVDVPESEKVEFRAKIEAPKYNYEGPLNIDIISDNTDMAHVEISKIILRAPGKISEMGDRPTIMDIPKGQVFKQNLHLYGVIDFGQEVKRIEITQPFAFVSSDPKLPFKCDNKTGYLIDLYIQAPQQNYGGPLEIRFS